MWFYSKYKVTVRVKTMRDWKCSVEVHLKTKVKMEAETASMGTVNRPQLNELLIRRPQRQRPHWSPQTRVAARPSRRQRRPPWSRTRPTTSWQQWKTTTSWGRASRAPRVPQRCWARPRTRRPWWSRPLRWDRSMFTPRWRPSACCRWGCSVSIRTRPWGALVISGTSFTVSTALN